MSGVPECDPLERRMRVTITGSDRARGRAARGRAAGARRRGTRALAQPGARAPRRSASRRSPGSPSTSRRRPRRSRAATRVDPPRRRGRRPALDDEAKRRLLRSRELGTRNLVAGLRAADPRPAHARVRLRGRLLRPARRRAGDRGRRRRATTSSPRSASRGSARRRRRRSSACASRACAPAIVLDKGGGALAKMLPFFRLGVGGPVAGGRQYLPWIHLDDLVGALPRRARRRRLAGRGQRRRRPTPVTNKAFSRALGPRAAPPRVRAGARLRGPRALRRDGRHRRHRPARGAGARARARAIASATPSWTRRCASALAG